MIDRAHGWTPHYVDSPRARMLVELRHEDVGDVRGTIVLTVDDGSDPTTIAVGPFRPDELDDLAETFANAARDADRWSEETSR